VKFTDQGPLDTQLGRVSLLYQVEPQLQLTADGGYEDNHYTLTNYHGPIYGVGATWHPTDRTDVTASWEHRFFGASYQFLFEHRTPLSVWDVNASRNITTYPQQLATLPAGSSVALLLDQLLLATIPDPTQRQSYINQLIQSGGFPTLTSAPVNIYNQQITLQEGVNTTMGLLGVRNRNFVSGFYLRQQPISGAGTPLPGFLSTSNNNTQSGGDFIWTHNLTGSTSLATTFNYLRTVNNEPLTGTTNQGWVNVTLTTTLSPSTSVSGGARYQKLRSDISTSYTEAAVFIGLTYTYH